MLLNTYLLWLIRTMRLWALGMYRDVMRPYPHPRSAEYIGGLAAVRGGEWAEGFECVPVYKGAPAYVNGVSEGVFKRGLCLPAGPCVSEEDARYIVNCIIEALSKIN